MGYGHPGAAWALLGPDVTLRRTDYDVASAAATMLAVAADLPGIESMVDNVRASASDAEALEAFTDTVAQQREESGGS